MRQEKSHEKDFKGTVYMITLPDGRSYIGATQGFAQRRYDRKYTVHTRASAPIDRAISRFGWDNCVWTVLADDVPSRSDMDALERHFIRVFRTIYPTGWNFQSGGRGGFAVHPSTKAVASLRMKSMYRAKQAGVNGHLRGRSDK